ncbi:hypothetical protein PHLGIDRAFT_125891 [Phlebiopsis gigantea 11061_1 CR5-6]|uniref:Uncharacterized protein n=1 Tax=Phlebiopsis gigantea (strain 11061_1 CR5-6) TaxID=745531 RepID=A0A0C3NWV3_PHLG1|nr:hypothetical protein PHLGIDRAFT_125891 [Phlebiopsis gigantea 11061_1 CR5-6]
MHAVFTSLIALSAVALAAPVSFEARLFPLYARDASAITNGTIGSDVCGVPIPGSLQSCGSTPNHFIVASNGLNPSNSTTPPANHECDHSTAIHVLGHALTSNGACTALDGMLAASNTSHTKPMLMAPLFAAIGRTGNNVYLDAGANGAKATMMQQAFGSGGAQPSSSSGALSTVKAYFNDTRVDGTAQRLGSQLDRLTRHMLDHAATQANATISQGFQGTGRGSALAAVNAAKGMYNSSAGSAQDSWGKLQSYVGSQR